MTRLTHSLHVALGREIGLLGRFGDLLGRIFATLRCWQIRDRQRRELRELDDATLKDIGLSREQANFLADKPFWRQ